MKFNTAAIISLAMALSASASPIAVEDVSPVEKRGLEKRDDLVCLNRGPKVNRADIIWRIDGYCNARQGWTVKDGVSYIEHSSFNGHPLHLGVSGTGSGCEWTIAESCYSNLRKIVDQCNSDGENGKQGGIFSDSCATYHLTFVDH